jgi:hypothetical protein
MSFVPNLKQLKEGNIMALTDESGSNGMVMPVAPMYGGGNGMCNGFGGDWAWIILLLLLGWGNGNGFGGGFGGYGNSDFPWLMTGQQNINTNTNNGFRDAMINDGITSIRDGIGNLSTQLCNCCGDVQMSLANGFAGVEQGANARQMANMQQAFAAQTAMAQGFNALGSQFADCCCENRLANCQTQNIIQNEGNATRFADANNTRDLLQNQTANTQAILDKLCQLELDGKNTRIADLERQLSMAQLSASQTAQNAFIQQGFADEVDQLYNRLSNCPVPTTPVYGRTPIFTCNNGGCGCGGNAII